MDRLKLYKKTIAAWPKHTCSFIVFAKLFYNHNLIKRYFPKVFVMNLRVNMEILEGLLINCREGRLLLKQQIFVFQP